MFHFNLHHIALILIGYLSNISCSPLPFGLLSSQVSGNGITFSHVELPKCVCACVWRGRLYITFIRVSVCVYNRSHSMSCRRLPRGAGWPSRPASRATPGRTSRAFQNSSQPCRTHSLSTSRGYLSRSVFNPRRNDYHDNE